LVRLLHALTRPNCIHRARKESRLRALLARGVAPVAPTLTNAVGMEFIAVPPGQFLMGSVTEDAAKTGVEKQHRVTLTRGFLIGRHPVTQGQWQMVMADDPSFFHAPDLPVDSVTRVTAMAFVKALNQRDGRRYRLPTEAEWEYACRAGTSTPYWTGAKLRTSQANFNGASPNVRPNNDKFRERTTPIGTFRPNGWGLYDMHGNVWEWCEDGYKLFTRAARIDPRARTRARRGSYVLRGGSWWNDRERARSASRHDLGPGSTGSAVGLRLCLDVEE